MRVAAELELAEAKLQRVEQHQLPDQRVGLPERHPAPHQILGQVGRRALVAGAE